jgi:NitT/TauT family transport system substrate-binding protein
MQMTQSRRDFLASASLAATAGAAGILGTRASFADEAPLETTTVRIEKQANICFAPQYVAEELLHAEGFTDVRYVQSGSATAAESMAQGNLDFSQSSVVSTLRQMDSGAPIKVLAGVHPGCYELFAHEPVNTIADLRGRRVGIDQIGDGGHLLIPPEPQELRARRIGRVIVNTIMDKPWSEYFCCMLYGNRAWVREHPVATKRFLRAVFKAADFCSAEPQSAAQLLVDGGFAQDYDFALQTVQEVPYQYWREYDSEDSLRFYALRLHEVGVIRSSPNALLADGTDWRFVDELKRELKA